MAGILAALAFMALFTLLAYNRMVMMRNASDKTLKGMSPLLEERNELINRWMRQVPAAEKENNPLWKQLNEVVNRKDASLTADQQAAHDNLIREIVHRIKEEQEPARDAFSAITGLQALEEKEQILAGHRKSYNETTTYYNNAIIMFPSNVFALVFGFKTRKLFKI